MFPGVSSPFFLLTRFCFLFPSATCETPRTKEIVNVSCMLVDVSDFRVQRVKTPRTKEIVNVCCKQVDVYDFRVQRYDYFSVYANNYNKILAFLAFI